MLNSKDVDFLIECLKKGIAIPGEYKYELFPTIQKEYELIYAGKIRKEDVLTDTDEIANVPLQIEKTLGENKNGEEDDWKNLLIFGDNLQILKTLYYNKEPLIKDKVKGKIKLIYIDPPFSLKQEFKGGKGQKAYVDKVKGAEFIEFLRKRLILMRELLSDDGVIYVHLDYRKIHYVKVIMDEIFGENNFINEITWKRTSAHNDSGKYGINTEYLLFYSKTENYTWNSQFLKYSEKHLARFKRTDSDGRKWTDSPLTAKGLSGGGYTYEYKGVTDIWRCPIETMQKLDQEGKLHITKTGGIRVKKYLDELKGTPIQCLWDDIDPINSQSKERVSYPTQKPEELLRRIILSATNEGDLIMDCFAGSGTTLAVAEKTNRRWIGCDIGKLSLYTIQKRMLEIGESKNLFNPRKKYQKFAKAFSVITAGLYDLGKVFSLSEEKYKAFVKNLFDIEETSKLTIQGISIDGEKRGYYVKIYPYWDVNHREADVDEEYVEELHKHIGNRIKERFYIVAPANSVAFINDYYELEGVKYYFLKIPYQVIKELHNTDFKKLRQPQSAGQINDLEEAVGFHFIRQPEVKSELITINQKFFIRITKFMSDYCFDEDGVELENFESLSMVLIDNNPGEDKNQFIMTDYYFAQDLIKETKKEIEEMDEVEIRKELTQTTQILIPVQPVCRKVRSIYIDIYGNEFIESFTTEEIK